MSEPTQQSPQIAIQDLELTLQVYELESQQKLKKLEQLFREKGSIDPAKMFYEERSSLQVKFQNIISDLLEFLVRQQVAATEKLRKTFLRILDSPLILLFKVSKFEIFQIRFDGFDIELQPIEAIQELANSIYYNIDEYLGHCAKVKQLYKPQTLEPQLNTEKQEVSTVDDPQKKVASSSKQLQSYAHFLREASVSSLRDKIFILYSYLRKGATILNKKYENKIKIVEIFNQIQSRLCLNLLQSNDWKTLKELSVLNYEIYMMQNSFDVLCFYLKVPLKVGTEEVFKELQILAEKAKQNNNYDIFILIFVKHHKQVLEKLSTEGVHPTYYPYLENILLAILDLWACRLCHYRQFCYLFQTLFELYRPKQKILQLCLQHKPSVQNDDIVLLRTNFKLDLQNKQSQLLSLMGKRSLQEINSFLNNLYHRTLYNLDYRCIVTTQNKESLNPLEAIMNLLTLLNGNSSYQQFFNVVQQNALKPWNHTIDFQHGYKFIKGEFAYPISKKTHEGTSSQTQNPQVTQSIRLIRNFCILQDLHKTGNKEYQAFVKGNANSSDGSIGRILFEFVDFLYQSSDPKCQKLATEEQTQQMLLEVLDFLVRCGCALNINTNSNVKEGENETERICITFAKIINKLTRTDHQERLKNSIKAVVKKHCDDIHITKCIQIFKNLSNTVRSDGFHEENDKTSEQLVSMMLSGVNKTNQEILLFDLFDRTIDQLSSRQLTQRQSEFLIKQTEIKDGKIHPRNLGILKLSEFQLVTNPMQFQKVMDNIFFILDSNSKKFLQYLSHIWIQSYIQNDPTGFQFYTQCIQDLIIQYPITIPLLCCTRIQTGSQSPTKSGSYSLRFIQFACSMLDKPQTLMIIQKILTINCLRYKNGTNYIQQEINPMVFKQLVGILNTKCQKVIPQQADEIVRAVQLLTYAISNANADNLRLDTIQKAINKCNFLIAKLSEINISNPKNLAILSNSHFKLLHTFFKKKQKDMRLPPNSLRYEDAIWSEVRFYTPNSNQKNSANTTDINITDHTIVSPYSVSREYNVQQFKINKIVEQTTTNCKTEEKKVNLKDIEKQISRNNSPDANLLQSMISSGNNSMTNQKTKDINLSKLKWNLRLLLGAENIKTLESKQNVRLIQGQRISSEQNSNNTNQQRNSMVHYYLKQLQIPAISENLVINVISSLLQSSQNTDIYSYLYLWANAKNFERLFVNLMAIYQFIGWAAKSQAKLVIPIQNQQTPAQRILTQIVDQRQETLKKILEILTQIGYSDLWCQSFKSIESKPMLTKPLTQLASGFCSDQQSSLLPMLLKASLQNEQLQNQLQHPLDKFLCRLFNSRGASQTSLMYKVYIDRELLNLIMKSLSIQHLNEVSFLIHSNFNNLRLYTDQLHQGLKALNMASKNRSYNEFVQLSSTLKDFQDEQFSGPMKLFKENFGFWIRIQKEGYAFKKEEQVKLALQRFANLCRSTDGKNQHQIRQEAVKIVQGFLQEIQKLQNNLANRVKSFYLVTKLRDLSYQNAVTISTLHSVLKQRQYQEKSPTINSQSILEAINKIELFTLLNTLINELVQVDTNISQLFSPNSQINYTEIDWEIIQHSVTTCSTRRFSHSMSKVFQKSDLEFDEVIQRCYDAMKMFFASKQGKQWILQTKHKIYPAFLVRSFIDDCGVAEQFTHKVRSSLISIAEGSQPVTVQISTKGENLISQVLKGLRSLPIHTFYKPASINLILDGKPNCKLQQLFPHIKAHLLKTETLQQCQKSPFLIFNKYKTSQATLEEIQALGYIIAYSIFNSIPIGFPLHPSITAALSFNISSLQDLITIDFATWEQLKSVLAHPDSKSLNLTFSHNFSSLKTFEEERVQLLDKGASKKVNNLNRQQYVDLVACHLMYRNCQKQLQRLLKTILRVVPKNYISCVKVKTILQLFYINENETLLGQIMKNLTQKIGLVLPDFLITKSNQRIDNLKDYQNIHWLCEILLAEDAKKLRQKIWPEETNLFIVTTIGSKGTIQIDGQVIVINHFGTKEDMAATLKKL